MVDAADILILLVGILFLFGLGILLGPDRLRPEDQGPPPWECPDTFPQEWAEDAGNVVDSDRGKE